jgi:hypothetical protein
MIPILEGLYQTTSTATASSTGEKTLLTIAVPGRYRYGVDLAALLGGATPDIFTFRPKIKLTSTGVEAACDPPGIRSFTGGLIAEPNQESEDFDVPISATITIDREQGSQRTIPWVLLRERQVGSVAASTGNSSTGFLTDLTSTGDDVHNRKHLRLLTGALATQVDKIADYVGATKRVVLQNGFTATPTSGDDFELVDV